MDVVDLDELAADAVGEPGRSRRWQRRLPGRRPLAAVSGALVLALLTAGAIVASRDPLRVQVEGMRDGPRVGWSSPQGLSEFVAVDGDRVVTSDDLTIRARRADDGVELWSVDRGALGLTSVSELRDLPGTPWVLVGTVTSNAWETSLVLLDRGTGRIAHRMELPAATATVDDLTGPILDNLMVPTLVATGQGALFALLPTQNGGRLEVAKLASPSLDDVVWRAELPMSLEAFPLGDPHAEERAGHLLLGRGEQDWPGRYVAALTLADGAPAAILAGTDDGLIAEVGDGRLTLVSPRTGTELWSVPVADEWLSVTRWGDAVVAYAGQQSTWGDPGPRAGVVAAFDLATGEQRWRADLGDPVIGLFRGEGQLVAMQYGWKGGGPEPEITHSRELEDGISVITTVLFSSNGLAGIDPGTGAVRWREDLGEGWMTRYGTRIVHAGSPDHEFLR
jgi:outer membrane protein assembly factor BamB